MVIFSGHLRLLISISKINFGSVYREVQLVDYKKSLKSRKVDFVGAGRGELFVGMDLDDLLSEPVVVNARAGFKFQPKARPKGKVKGTVLPTPSQFDSSKDKPVAVDDRHADILKSVAHLVPLAETVSVNSSADTPDEIPRNSTVIDSSSQPVIQHSVNHTGALFQEVSVSDGDRIFASANVSPQFGTRGADVASPDPSFVGVANFSDIHADKQAGFTRSGVETADIFSDLESLDDILPQPAMSNGNTVKKFQPKVKVNSQPTNKLPISRPVASEADSERLASVASNPNASIAPEINSNPDIVEVSQEVLNYGDAADALGVSWVGDMRLEREEEAFGGINSQDTATGNPFLVPCANESLEEDLTPTFPSDSFIDSSTMGFSNSVPRDASPEQLTHELESSAERSYPELVTQEELVDLQAGHVISGGENERSVSAASNKNGTGKSSRLLRNEVSHPVAADEMAEETRENQHLLSEPAQNSSGNVDNNDDYCRGEEAPNSNRTPENSKKPVSGNEKTGRRRKKADGPDSSDKELPKKKFSHSTRRNRRKVDKILLETPDHEIDPRKLTLKDLILLAEAKERLLSKDPNAAKNSLPNQRNTRDTSFGEEDSFGLPEDSFGLRDDSFGLRDDSSFGYQDDEQAAPSAQPKLNYHTFMKRTSKQSWSQQDTELFYEGIRQFGTDFAMIQQLFPGRTRHQVKLKYKKEEKQHPQRLSDALTNRSKNHSHFELVIERLKKAAAEAEAEQNSNRDDESVGLTGEEEEVTHDTNEEVTQNKNQDKFEEEEMGEGTMEAEEVATVNHQGYNPVKCHQESEEEDVYDIWSEYKSDI
ncbi:hypothetical protein C5167_003125 [Papaver somniferum]|uniref:SANT domain-containing protein n=1 Tax=Papaver somniferum TaxID=3469 RepID=A0A4Y7L407_PAPSO|nr:hypothetical protein C5167_003125 [Papaver somniferum]